MRTMINSSLNSAQVKVRPFKPGDAVDVSDLIRQNFLQVNIKDYPQAEMERLSIYYSPKKLIELAGAAHAYVACLNDEIVGCGSIARQAGSEDTCELTTIFVRPDCHARQVGRMIIAALEADDLVRDARRLVLHSSITATMFYLKMGYVFCGGQPQLDENGLYWMEKVI
jgi:N-acetylglutamate synthase-like GNAT family acetyltransferase